MKICFYLLLSFSILLAGCEKEEILPGSVNELVFSCPDGSSESYFEGVLGNNNFCYHDQVDGYEVKISQTASFTTDGPTTSTEVDPSQVGDFRVWGNMGFMPAFVSNGSIHGTPIPHLKHYVLIGTPSSLVSLTTKELISQSLTATGTVPLQSDKVASTDGFNVVLHYNDLEDGHGYSFEARGGNQDGSFLEVKELEITDWPGGKHYQVTFEFACKLYLYGDPKKFYDRMEGTMRLEFDL